VNDSAPFASVRHLPILGWGRAYNREDLGGDLLAGLITAILLVPQAWPSGCSSFAGTDRFVREHSAADRYALFGTSRTLAVGPVSVAAIMVAQALAGLPAGADHLSSALLLALLSGVILFALGLARLGVLANFLSHPVLSGFTSAAADHRAQPTAEPDRGTPARPLALAGLPAAPPTVLRG
jgi:SulP family sulfate permease